MTSKVVYHDLSQLIAVIDNAAVAIVTESHLFLANERYNAQDRAIVHIALVKATNKLMDYATYLEECERDAVVFETPAPVL